VVLAHWCAEFKIVVDYQVGAERSTDMLVMNKLHYHLARRIRLLELMCDMQFLRNAHQLMIRYSFQAIGTRRGPMCAFIDHQVWFTGEQAELGVQLLDEESLHLYDI